MNGNESYGAVLGCYTPSYRWISLSVRYRAAYRTYGRRRPSIRCISISWRYGYGTRTTAPVQPYYTVTVRSPIWQGEKCQRWWCQHRENSQNHHLIIFPPPYRAGVYWIRWQEGELWIEETLVEWKWRGHHTRQRARGDKMPLIAVRMFGPTFPSPIPQRPRHSYTCSWHLHPRKTICYGLLDVEIMSWIFAHQIEHVYVQYWQITTFLSDLNSSLGYYPFTFVPVVSKKIPNIYYRTIIWYTIYFRMIRGLCKCFNEYWSDEFQHSQSHSKV